MGVIFQELAGLVCSKAAFPGEYRLFIEKTPTITIMQISRLASKGYCHSAHAQSVRTS